VKDYEVIITQFSDQFLCITPRIVDSNIGWRWVVSVALLLPLPTGWKPILDI